MGGGIAMIKSSGLIGFATDNGANINNATIKMKIDDW